MSKLHSLKRNLNPGSVTIAKFAAELDKKKGINRFLGRRSQRNKTVEEKIEPNV